MGFYSDTS